MNAITGSRRPGKAQAGFTLAEMLVSLAVFGLVASLLLAGMKMSGAVGMQLDRNRQGDDQVAAAQMVLRDRIERMRGVVSLDSSTAVIDARGTDREFAFHAPPPRSLGPHALHRYRLLLSSRGDLVLYSISGLDSRIDPRSPELAGWTPARLLSGVKAVSISYFGPDRLSGAWRWQQFWRDRPEPPALVKIDLAFLPGDARNWPPLVIRPRVTVNSACWVDEVTGRCGGTL